jgi:hypothetical protein
MPRTIVDVPDGQLREVDQICKALNISRAEAVRRGLVAFIRENSAVSADGFGLWKGCKTTGADLIDGLRRQW